MRVFAWPLVFSTMIMTLVLSVSAQEDKQITAIRGKVAAINKSAARYTRTKRDVFGISTEGAEATYFQKGKELKKITAKIYGETFNASAELYFENGNPLFYYLKINRYDTQIGLKKPVKVVRVEEERYYFAGTAMIRVMLGTKIIRETDEKYAEMRDGILQIAKELLEAYDSKNSSSTDSPFE